jgi:enoyl-CoA hydratase/carnithine racemase
MEHERANPAVRLETDGPVLVVTLNRPERRNAIDYDTNLLLAGTLRKADEDPSTRAIVLTGEGRGFCSGGDVKGMVGSMSFGVSYSGC